jgi:hypothetical protein
MSRFTFQKRDGNYSLRFDLGNLQQVDIIAMNKLGKLEDLEEELGCPLEFVIEQLRKGFFLTYIDGRWLFCKLIPNDENEQLFEMKAFKTKEVYDYVCLAKEALDENGKVKFKDSACMTFPKSKEGYNEA